MAACAAHVGTATFMKQNASPCSGRIARIAAAIAPGEHVVALDEGGKSVSSVQVAARLDRWAMEGRGAVAFVIGGPNGLDREWLARVPERWSLSKMTLPHRLARLVLMEQIYRGCTINRGEPYHK